MVPVPMLSACGNRLAVLAPGGKGLCTDRHDDVACADQGGGAWAGSHLTAEQEAQRSNTGSAWAGQVSKCSPCPYFSCFQIRTRSHVTTERSHSSAFQEQCARPFWPLAT